MKKYTLKQIKNAYGMLLVSPDTRMWICINNGKTYTDYLFRWSGRQSNASTPTFIMSSHTRYEHINFHRFGEVGFLKMEIVELYDYENFMRHFGMYFLKF